MAPSGSQPRPIIDTDNNQIIAMIRVGVEHPFPVVKHQFGHRYHRFAKNGAKLIMLLVLGDSFLQRKG